MSILAVGNLPTNSGTSSSPAGTSALFSVRTLNTVNDPLESGEIVVVVTQATGNAIFDWSLPNANNAGTNAGFGGIRSMSSSEMVTASSTVASNTTQYLSDVASLQAAYTTIKGYIANPGTQPSTLATLETQLFPFLEKLLRVIAPLIPALDVTDDQQTFRTIMP